MANLWSVLQSFELRWFYDGELPDIVKEWFETGLPGRKYLDAELPRVDYYLLAGNTDSLGIKLSRKRLEIKQLTKYFDYLSADQQISGRAEHWIRWEWNDKNPELGLEPILSRFNWTTIKKSRIQRKYIISDDKFDEVPITSMDGECAIEITGLEFDDNLWWSLALDSYGSGEVGNRLSRAANELLVNFPTHKPKIEISYGYPKWLNLITIT